ncbi:MAG TPA: MerR family transcriptional regulator [Mycobacterium sp.]|jgi:DNA-binding transcriptional MerR regulator
MELTLDELARRSGMTGRNIRQWQTYGLIPPPERRGRVGIYTGDHLARINRIKELRAQGFPLDLIRRVLETPAIDAEADVRQLAAGALAPFADEQRVRLTELELEARLGAGIAVALKDAGLVESADDTYLIDAAVLSVLESAASAGLSPATFASTLAKAHGHHRAIAALLLDTVREEVWRPFIDAGMPTEKWHKLAGTVDRLREVGMAAQSYLFRRALDEVLTGVLVEEAARLRDRLH